MKVAFITTVNHNIGDDFVRDGIDYLLRRATADGAIATECVHKHLPLSARHTWRWFHTRGWARCLDRLRPGLALRVSRVIDSLPLRRARDLVLDCDVLVQCGAPVYWVLPNSACEDNEWRRPLLERRWTRVRDRVPFLNLAAGSCQPYASDAGEFAGAPRTLDYVRWLTDIAAVTTVRDRLAQKILEMAGRSAPLLPCTSIFAAGRRGVRATRGDFVALNFMPTGGHYSLGGGIDPAIWHASLATTVRRLRKSYRCLMVCHDDRERRLAEERFPEIDRVQPASALEALQIYAGARFGVLNRVHGAFALASFGKPALVVGNDSRARMIEMLGLSSVFVGEATPDRLEEGIGILEARTPSYPAEFAKIRDEAETEYVALLRGALESVKST